MNIKNLIFSGYFLAFALCLLFLSACTEKSPETLFTKVNALDSGLDFNNKLILDDSVNILDNEFVYNGAGVALGDLNNDGLDDSYEGATQIDIDVNDEIDDPFSNLPNTDGDSESDYRDDDDDDDGMETAREDVNGDGDFTNDDADGDGTPDYLEPNLTGNEIEVFNVITPNGDGVHDVLSINGLENYPDNTIKIYNRWGVLVYTTNAYDTEGNIFDGTSQGRVTVAADRKLPVGTYFYILN